MDKNKESQPVATEEVKQEQPIMSQISQPKKESSAGGLNSDSEKPIVVNLTPSERDAIIK